MLHTHSDELSRLLAGRQIDSHSTDLSPVRRADGYAMLASTAAAFSHGLPSVQLLHKLSIRATNGPNKLLQVIQNPITDHLPADARIYGAL